MAAVDELTSGLADRASINYSEIAVAVVLKFIDVLEAAVIIVVGLIVVRIAKRHFQKIETTHERQRTGLNLLEKITSGFIIVVTVTLALKVVGLDITLIVGVITLGMSFGVRDVIKNYVAGLLILFKAPFEIHDVIKIRNYTGRVEKIEFQSVTLQTFDHKEVTIQNSDLLTQPITNFSRMPETRLSIDMLLGYGTDSTKAMMIFDRILKNHPEILQTPKYSIVFGKFDEFGMNVTVRFWVKRPGNPLRIKSEVSLALSSAFDEAIIIAPYNREAGLSDGYSMTEARKERLKLFYGQPMLADLATQTATQVAVATEPVVAEYADAEEPE